MATRCVREDGRQCFNVADARHAPKVRLFESFEPGRGASLLGLVSLFEQSTPLAGRFAPSLRSGDPLRANDFEQGLFVVLVPLLFRIQRGLQMGHALTQRLVLRPASASRVVLYKYPHLGCQHLALRLGFPCQPSALFGGHAMALGHESVECARDESV